MGLCLMARSCGSALIQDVCEITRVGQEQLANFTCRSCSRIKESMVEGLGSVEE